MVRIHHSHTTPINPPSTTTSTTNTPPLTLPQIWQGLQRKIRFAHEFVPIIQSCTVLSDENGIVTRSVVFKPGAGPKAEAKETVRSFWPSWVDFEQEDGTVIRNVVSYGGEGEGDLYMTYVFEFDFPGVEEGSVEAEREGVKIRGMAKVAVEKSIETIRQMVVDGRIK